MDKLLFATVRIEIVEGGRKGLCSAFILAHIRGDQHAPFLITSSNAIHGATRGRLAFTPANNGKPVIDATLNLEIDDFQAIWRLHGSADFGVAVAPLAPMIATLARSGREIFYTAIDQAMIPSLDGPNDVEAVEEVVLVGHPSGLYDPGRSLPVVQRGLTATPFHLDYRNIPGFLVNAAILPGAAGSPVVSARRVPEDTSGRSGLVKSHLLGLIAGLVVMDENGRVGITPVPLAPVEGTVSSTRLSMGLAVRSSMIEEAITGLL